MTCQLSVLDSATVAARVSRRAQRTADEEAFGLLVAASHAQLERLAYLLCGNRAQAEDAVGEAYAKVWPKFRRRTVENPAGYLRTAVVNQVRGSFRRQVLEVREQRRHTVDWRDGAPAESNADDRQLLEPVLRSLPARYRAVIVLRFYEDMSEAEIARVLDVPPGTVKSRCARGLEILRARVADLAV
jgi:RNA polymerase sigma-70 factor (sigma-E family)